MKRAGWRIRSRPGAVLVLTGVTALAVLAIAPVGAAPSGGSALPPGCAAGRTAVAYRSDGSSAPASGAPVPCANNTGYGGAETYVRTAPNGAVVEEPAILDPGLAGTGVVGNAQGPRPENADANTSGLVVSNDHGGTWQLVQPGGAWHACCDAALYIDRVTGRLFYSAIFGAAPTPANQAPQGESQVMSSPASPAGYVSWTSTTMFGHVAENPRFTSGPAPTGQPPAVPGERMAYWCANTGPGYEARTCYRSFDGGTSWQVASVLFTNPVPQHAECGTSGESFGGLDGNYPQGGSDGALWVMVQCGGTTYLAKSTDEGSSFPIIHGSDGTPMKVPGSPRELRVDTAGNLYAVQQSGSSLLLRISRDGGQTWSAPLNMTAPSARGASIYQWQVAAGYQPGQVAVSYLSPRSSGGYDGYISVTHDALNPNPVYYGATVNPPGTPMVTQTSFGDDWIQVDLGPDGNPWAAFYSDCLKDQAGNFTDPSCAQDQGQLLVTGPPFVAAAHAETVGHLLWPRHR